MSINGANNYGGGFQQTTNYGGGFMMAANQGGYSGPTNYNMQQNGDLWCQPIQNFRLDTGFTNLYSQNVSIDWPQFSPQNPIFSGPRVKQDTTNVYANPGINYNFDDCNITGGFTGGYDMGGGYLNMGGGAKFGF